MWNAMPISGLLTTRDVDTLEILQQRAMNAFKKLEHLTQEKLGVLGPLSLEKAQGHVINVPKYLEGQCRED